MQQALLWAAAGTGFTFSMTALGAAMVFFMKKQSTALMQRIFLGFAAGVMIAASVWSLLIPAIEETEQAGGVGWLPASGGFLLGILLMLLRPFGVHDYIVSDGYEGCCWTACCRICTTARRAQRDCRPRSDARRCLYSR